MSSNTTQADTSEAFLDTCVLLNYTLDGVDTAIRLFENHPDVEKVTSKKGQSEFQELCDRRAEIVSKLRETIKDGRSLDQIDITEFGWLSPNDEGYFGDLLAELDGSSRERIIERLNEEENILESGEISLFERPDQLVNVIEIDKTEEWEDLFTKLSFPVDNSNDQALLCDATVWHINSGSGSFISEDSSDITEANPPGNAGAVSDQASLFDISSGGPEDINLQIELVYSAQAKLNIFTTSEFLDML